VLAMKITVSNSKFNFKKSLKHYVRFVNT